MRGAVVVAGAAVAVTVALTVGRRGRAEGADFAEELGALAAVVELGALSTLPAVAVIVALGLAPGVVAVAVVAVVAVPAPISALVRGSAVEFAAESAVDFLSAVAINPPASAKLSTAAASTA